MNTRKERKLQVTMRNSEIGNEQGREFEIHEINLASYSGGNRKHGG
jgi:hypothetical protein